MVFDKETFEVKRGMLSKGYEITDEAKACEIAVQKELVTAIQELTRALRMKK